VEGSCELGNETLGSVKYGEYPDSIGSTIFSRRIVLHAVRRYMTVDIWQHVCALSACS
jgi:UDP-N-acetyl-D-mannosaminuronic acid transferase (WecB/TagA/CpsF family)